MLLKTTADVFFPAVAARPYRPYSRECPPPPPTGGSNGTTGGSAPTQGCKTVITYGPPSPVDGGPTIIGYQTVCYG